MTTLHEINGHSVDVPEDFTVVKETGFPGANDYIRYRGVSIYTVDTNEPAGHAYEGGFILDLPSKIDDVNILQDVKSLKEARELIDEISKPKLPLRKNVPDIMTLTIAQAKAVYKKWLMMEKDQPTFNDFMDTVMPTIGCDGAVTVYWCGMWLCIEKDGYTHS